MDVIESLRKVWSDGRHNAFPSLIRFRNRLFLSFRSSTGHAENDGRIALLCSDDDGATWRQLPSPLVDRDYYEGFLVEFQGRLFMYGGGYPNDMQYPVWCYHSREFFSSSEDGEHWGPVQEIYPPYPVRFWRPIVIGEKLYVGAYRSILRTDRERDMEVDLYCSEDGQKWHYVSDISRERAECHNETALVYRDGTLTAFLRSEARDRPMTMRTSREPFSEWSEPVRLPFSLLGPDAFDMNGRRFLFGRWRGADMPKLPVDRSTVRLRSFVQEADGTFRFYAEFPSAFDCTYSDAVKLDDRRMLVAYYSQHEHASRPDFKDMATGSDIFLATVRTDG